MSTHMTEMKFFPNFMAIGAFRRYIYMMKKYQRVLDYLYPSLRNRHFSKVSFSGHTHFSDQLGGF